MSPLRSISETIEYKPLKQYYAKYFNGKSWKIVGTVYAENSDEAWTIAVSAYGKVSQVVDKATYMLND